MVGEVGGGRTERDTLVDFVIEEPLFFEAAQVLEQVVVESVRIEDKDLLLWIFSWFQVSISNSSSRVPKPPGRMIAASDRSYIIFLRTCMSATI
ncbi:hypothetical protein ACQ86N_05800 [Puia sp. P3]|uniref:hypothetical protein n=1 Tax=Puia sp. P3 TaxID=3423952 RepID=UPI003D667516